MRKKKETISRPKQLRVKLVRSVIGYPEDQRATVRGLGLRRLNDEVIRADTPEIRGMIKKVALLVKVEYLEG